MTDRERFRRALHGLPRGRKGLLLGFFADDVARILEGLFPFASLSRADRNKKKSELPDKPKAVPTRRRKSVRIDIPLPAGGQTTKQQISIRLDAERAHFQGVRDRSKGYVTRLAKAAAEAIELSARSLIESSSPKELLPQLRATLPAAIVARFLKDTFTLSFEVERFLEVLFDISARSYEAKPTTQGFLVSRGTESAQHDVLSLLSDHAKQILPTTDGYHTALEINQAGKCLRLVDLKKKCKEVGIETSGDGDHPDWLESIARLTTEQEQYLCAIILTQHGDVLVLRNGRLILSYRAGAWRTHDHRHFRGELVRAVREVGRPKSGLPALAKAIYLTALDVSFRHTGGLIGVLKRNAKRSPYIDRQDELNPNGPGLLGVVQPQRFQGLDRAVRAALAAIDGAIVVDYENELVAFGAVVKIRATLKARAQRGARTRAAFRLSQAGMAVKVSADGDVELYERGKMTRRLL